MKKSRRQYVNAGADQAAILGYAMSETELNVVCKSCGAEVSPYVTECPYCGARLRKRAPELELGGDGGLEPKQTRREKRREDALRAAGWMVIRLSWADLTNPARVEALIRPHLRVRVA